MSSSSSIKVRFLIEKEEKRVVYVETGSDFVDVLFSFLTLPLGAIVRLLKKRSGLGSLDSLYESIEQLDAQHLQTEACKEMLLNPRSAAAVLCEDLKVKGIHELKPRSFYTCRQDGCLIHSICYFTYTSNVLCSRCGELMDRIWEWKKTTEEGGVFVKATTEFMITDDLRVMPASLLKSLSLLKEMHIKDTSMLEERVMQFETKEALNLLGRSLVSENALTEVCFPDACVQESASFYIPIKEEMVDDEAQNEIKVELILNKKNNSVLYAEVGDDFTNHLFSFLAFPLGSVLKFLSDMSPRSLGGCIQNLYSSVENMGLEYFKSEICRNMLLTPKLALFFGYKNQLILKLEEITASTSIVKGSCAKCYSNNGCKTCSSTQCVHGIRESEFVEQNPKSAKGLLDDGGGFVVGCRRLGIMDNLHISLLSTISAVVNGENLSISDLVGKELSLDKCKARSLLHAMMISKTVLTDVFAPRRKQPRQNSMKYA